VLWSRRFGQASLLTLHGLGVDASGHVYVSGNVNGDIDFGTGTLPATSVVEEPYVVRLAP
jgi:hypothetical protein